MMTKKIFLLLFGVLTLTSCNLFIEEEDDGQEFKNVPVQTGEGYDTPATYSDDNIEVTYQFKEGVRYLTERDQQYIVYVERDEINALIEIHYRLDTPEELLPVPGEILVSGVTDKFDWGCNHRMQHRIKEDGVYKYLGTFCKLQEIYSRLDIEGEALTSEEESYYVLPDPLDDEETDAAGARTRAETDNSKVDVSFSESGLSLAAIIDWSFSIDGPAGISAGVSLKAEENRWEITTLLKFDDFSLDNMVFQMIKTVDDQNTIRVNVAKTFSRRIHKFHPVNGKPFTIGPVVIVFFMDIDVRIDVSVTASVIFKKHKKTRYTYTIDLYNMTCTKKEEKLKDEGWHADNIEIEGGIKLTFDFIFGFGIYGKVLSVRFVPYVEVGFSATAPSKSGGIWDASASEGVDFFVNIGGKVQLVIDFTWDALFGSTPRTVDEAQVLLDEAKELMNKNSELYNTMASDKDANDILKGDNNEVGVTLNLGPWPITPLCASWPWFPKLKDKSFKIVKQWSADGKTLDFNAEYELSSIGFIGNIGKTFYPALMIKKGSTMVKIVPAEDGGSFSDVEKNKMYHFKIAAMKDDVQYTAIPCYYDNNLHIIAQIKPVIIDKGLTFYTTTPSMSITSVVPQDYKQDYDKNAGYGSSGGYEYRHTFNVDSRTSIKGIQNISSWGVRDDVSGTTNSKSKNGNYQDKDGTYVMHWTFRRYSHYSSAYSRQQVHIKLVPRYSVVGDDNLVLGSPYEIMVYSDRTYDEIDDGSGFGMTDMNYSRRARPTLSDDADDGETEVILESIEDPDGNVVWQRDETPASWMRPL